ncbi:NuA4-domain-containing protein [Mollisia scopiformis]|uniref:Chromatin modification-related protein EAF6 n=1 Tax=Mollisia scopiformis TaxID=149040 RepID=A0A194XT09_MOLSC|nr:NuA4-domain-containing protein [Mollisia scopiformis]KUJ22852.1 NuA4-domain-containing protein [Mollisia scopiformis]
MSENQPPAAAAGATGDIPGQPYYDKTRQHLRELLHKRKMLERSLAMQEETIYKKETDYLEDTPGGNIITGFESYTKGITNVAGGRRRGGVQEINRVFSRSSVTWNVNAESPMDTAQSTPVAAMAPTPLTTSFQKESGGGSNHATPTSATSANKSGGAGKKNKKGVNGDDSETEREGNKKIRTNFGAVRK